MTLLLRVAKRAVVFARTDTNQIGFAPRLDYDDCVVEAVHFLPRRITHPDALQFDMHKSFMDLMWTYPAIFPWTVENPEDGRIPYVIPIEERESNEPRIRKLLSLIHI